MGPMRPTIFFLAKNYQRLVQIGLAPRRLVQDGRMVHLGALSAGWCSLMQIGAA